MVPAERCADTWLSSIRYPAEWRRIGRPLAQMMLSNSPSCVGGAVIRSVGTAVAGDGAGSGLPEEGMGGGERTTRGWLSTDVEDRMTIDFFSS